MIAAPFQSRTLRTIGFLLLGIALSAGASERGVSTFYGGGGPPVVAGKVAWFFGANGRLWSSDGTLAGTRTLGDGPLDYGRKTNLVTLGDSAYFLSWSLTGNIVLYRASDSTLSPSLVTQHPGVASLNLSTNGSLLFFFTRELNGTRLWRSDGTREGTRGVATFMTDEASVCGRAGRSALFEIYPPQPWTKYRTNYDIWSSDGTLGGTQFLLDEVPTAFHAADDFVLFANAGKLWRSDGTRLGTFPIFDGEPSLVVTAGQVAYFVFGDAIWRTDGSAIGTTQFARLTFRPIGLAIGSSHILALDTRLPGLWLWSIDESGHATLIKTMPAPTSNGPRLTRIGSGFYLVVSGSKGPELWTSDGTVDGTRLLHTFDFVFYDLLDLEGRLFFFADDGVHGGEPWVSDGTPEGTRLINVTPEGSILGRVTDAQTGAAVTDATIEVRNIPGRLVASAAVDANGDYVVEGMRADTYEVTAKGSASHAAQTRVARVTVRPAENVGNIDFKLTRGGRFSGRVTGPDGKPQSNIPVHVAWVVGSPTVTATTGADGTFLTNAVSTDRPWLVYVDPQPGIAGALQNDVPCALPCTFTPSVPVSAKAGETTTGVDFHLKRWGKIAGTLTNAVTGSRWIVPIAYGSGDPLRHYVRVHAFPTDKQFPSYITELTADANLDGTFEMTLPPGSYRIGASTQNGGESTLFPSVPFADFARATIVVPTPGETTTCNIAIQPRGGRIRGRITDAVTGAPVGGVVVSIADAATGRSIESARSRNDGSYESSWFLSEGKYILSTSSSITHNGRIYDGGTPVTLASKQDLDGIDFRLNRLATIRGRVVDAVTNEPIAATVIFTSAEFRQAGALTKAADGAFQLTVQPGRYFGIAQASGYATMRYGEDHPCEAPCYGNGGVAIPIDLDQSANADFRMLPACAKTIAPASIALTAAGGSGTFVVDAAASCAWSVLAIRGGNFVRVQKTGPSQIRYVVEPNVSDGERTATIVLPGAVFRITQDKWRRRAVH